MSIICSSTTLRRLIRRVVFTKCYFSKEAKKDSQEKLKQKCKKDSKPVAKGDPRRVFKIYRFDGTCKGKKPRVQSFDLDLTTCRTDMVLDALIRLKEIDPTITFRRSCREGICGSCAINLQGYNCLACITRVPASKTVTIYPIPHMYVIRDLVVDMTHFINGYNAIRPYLIRNPAIKRGTEQYAQSVQDSLKMVGLYECILCACCSTSCPSYWWNGRRFMGPAALLHAYRWVIDSRDGDSYQRLKDLRDDFKLYRCHSIFNCALSCPKGLNPGKAIAKLKLLVSGLKNKPLPDVEPMKFAKKRDKCK